MSVTLLGPFFGRCGFGTVARGLARALVAHDPEVELVDLADFPGGRLRPDPALASRIVPAAGHDRPWVRIDVPWRLEYERPSAASSILYTMFEAGPLPDAWARGLVRHEWVTVPSRFCADLFADLCPRVKVIPLGVGEAFSPSAPPLRLQARSVVFLFVGEFTHRKGVDLAVRAFARAFTGRDDVTLVLKTWSSRLPPERVEAWVHERMREATNDPPHVQFFHSMLPDSLLPSLYTASTALIMPSRSEGFGLPGAEAQACGVPVIATGLTGMADSLSLEATFLLRTVGSRPARGDDLPWDYYGGRLMPEPDEDHLVETLRLIAADPRGAQERAGRAHRPRSWHEVARELLDVVSGFPL